MKNIAILASGSGSNAENIIKHFSKSKTAKVKVVLSNKKDAYVLTRAANLGVDNFYLDNSQFREGTPVVDILERYNIDYVVLAGFLLLVPSAIIEKYEGRIINIHPALLPNYGGKGMYGDNVHKAVIAAGEKESGITIHNVNEHYDSGDIIFQAKVQVIKEDDYQSLASKIHELEYKYFPTVIEQEIEKL